MVDQVFRRVEASLLAHGFTRVAEIESPEAFGSRYSDYERAKQGLRLIWDGRDGWFVLQGGTPWGDLLIQRPVGADERGIASTAESLLAAALAAPSPGEPAA